MTRTLVSLAVLLSLSGWAKGRARASCGDRCKDDDQVCVDVCTSKGAAKTLAQCRQMCHEGEKYCLDQCKKKGS